jgi:hypothetical protein
VSGSERVRSFPVCHTIEQLEDYHAFLAARAAQLLADGNDEGAAEIAARAECAVEEIAARRREEEESRDHELPAFR